MTIAGISVGDFAGAGTAGELSRSFGVPRAELSCLATVVSRGYRSGCCSGTGRIPVVQQHFLRCAWKIHVLFAAALTSLLTENEVHGEIRGNSLRTKREYLSETFEIFACFKESRADFRQAEPQGFPDTVLAWLFSLQMRARVHFGTLLCPLTLELREPELRVRRDRYRRLPRSRLAMSLETQSWMAGSMSLWKIAATVVSRRMSFRMSAASRFPEALSGVSRSMR